MHKRFLFLLLMLCGSAQAATSVPVRVISSPINLSAIATRGGPADNCVAQCSVFFDATGTTASGVTYSFLDLQGTWGFGDPGSGNWSNGSGGNNSKNVATGLVAAHVFETPGTYTITVTLTDGTNTVSTPLTVVVTDPDAVFSANTICIAALSLPVAGSGGCPTGATALQQSSVSSAFSTALGANGCGTGVSCRRLLFKKGDTFTSSALAAIVVNGPGIVGAYGSGANPIFDGSGSNADIIRLSSSTTPTIGDWRLVDLTLVGQSGTSSMGVEFFGGFNQFTALRLNISAAHNGILAPSSILNFWNGDGNPAHSGHKIYDQHAIVDSTITAMTGGAGGNNVFVEGTRMTILGASITDSHLVEHVVRIPYGNKSVISNNTIAQPATAKHNLKLHAPTFGLGGVVTEGNYTQYVMVSDNQFTGATGSDWMVSLEPQGNNVDERLRFIVVERNWTLANASTQIAFHTSMSQSTVRNNLCDMTNAGGACVSLAKRGLEPDPANVEIFNNSFFNNTAAAFTGASIASGVTGTSFKNNLGYSPNTTSPVMFTDSGSGTTASGNTCDTTGCATRMKTDPLFTATPPTTPAEFKPTTGSYAIGGGTSVPVWSDFFGVAEPATRDIGAVVH